MKLRPRLLVLAAPSVALLLAAALVAAPLWRGLLLGLALGPVLLALALAAVALVVRRKLQAARKLEPPPLPTSSWDYQMPLTDLNGQPVSTADWSGQVLLLNFWATWCAPCIAELPALRGLRERTADLGVQFAFISREKAETVRPFVARKGSDLPFYLLGQEPPPCFKGRAIPATFILDRSGTIVLRHFGAAAWDAESVVAFVRGLAATPS